VEEAWELAALVMEQQSEWTGRHVRLRYQMVVSALLFWMFCSYEMSEFALFGSVKFKEAPDQIYVVVTSGLFSIFSALSFFGRTSYERNFRYDEYRDSLAMKRIISQTRKKIQDHNDDSEVASIFTYLRNPDSQSRKVASARAKSKLSSMTQALDGQKESVKFLKEVLDGSLVAKKAFVSGEFSPISELKRNINSMENLLIQLKEHNEKIFTIKDSEVLESKAVEELAKKYTKIILSFFDARRGFYFSVTRAMKEIRRFRWTTLVENRLTSVYLPTVAWAIVFYLAIWRLIELFLQNKIIEFIS